MLSESILISLQPGVQYTNSRVFLGAKYSPECFVLWMGSISKHDILKSVERQCNNAIKRGAIIRN